MGMKKKQFGLFIVGAVFTCMTAFLAYSSVDNALSDEDRQYIAKYLQGIEHLPEHPAYRDELRFILAVQRSVLNIAPRNKGLPYGRKRGPKALYEARAGLCFDRSRVIEKILRYSGFETRHVSIFFTKKTRSAMRALITPDVASHAVTEVLTQKGWLLVDSNEPFVSIDENNQPVSIETMQRASGGSHPIQWKMTSNTNYAYPFVFVYGLYSRHGQFYPPYNFVPDINYYEFIQNII
jgi:hypothetical protein